MLQISPSFIIPPERSYSKIIRNCMLSITYSDGQHLFNLTILFISLRFNFPAYKSSFNLFNTPFNYELVLTMVPVFWSVTIEFFVKLILKKFSSKLTSIISDYLSFLLFLLNKLYFLLPFLFSPFSSVKKKSSIKKISQSNLNIYFFFS